MNAEGGWLQGGQSDCRGLQTINRGNAREWRYILKQSGMNLVAALQRKPLLPQLLSVCWCLPLSVHPIIFCDMRHTTGPSVVAMTIRPPVIRLFLILTFV